MGKISKEKTEGRITNGTPNVSCRFKYCLIKLNYG